MSQALKEACDRFVAISKVIPSLHHRAAEFKTRLAETQRIHADTPSPVGDVVVAAERAMLARAKLDVLEAEADLKEALDACRTAWEARKGGES